MFSADVVFRHRMSASWTRGLKFIDHTANSFLGRTIKQEDQQLYHLPVLLKATYIRPWWFGETDLINYSQSDRFSFNDIGATSCQSLGVPIGRPFSFGDWFYLYTYNRYSNRFRAGRLCIHNLQDPLVIKYVESIIEDFKEYCPHKRLYFRVKEMLWWFVCHYLIRQLWHQAS